MKNKKTKKRLEFNIHLSQEDRDVIDDLMNNGINVSKSFKIFIRKHLKKIKELNEDNKIS
jgi:hypothetical protein